jgi:peptidoglycan/xylan/chitin deacetylase (PgdA/CDA1 family)
VALPANIETVTVFGKYIDFTGTPMQGTVSFVPSQRYVTDSTADVLIFSAPLVATLDSDGAFSIEVPATDDPDITPQGFTWTVTESFNRKSGRTFAIAVPQDTPDPGIDLVKVAPVLPADNVAYIVTSVDGETGPVSLEGKYAPLGEDGKIPVGNLPSISSGVSSVNGQSGIVSLGAGDVGALPLTGGTMQGPLNLQADPTDPTQASTKAYADSASSTAAGAAVTSHVGATDPHGDRAYANGAFLPKTGGTITGDLSVSGRLTASGWNLPVSAHGRVPSWRDASSVMTIFQTGHGWSATGGNIASSNLNDTVDFVRGIQSAKFTTGGNGTAAGTAGQANLQKFAMPSFNLTSKMIRLIVKVENGANIGELNLFVGSSNLGSNYKWKLWATTASERMLKDGEWGVLTAGWGNLNAATGYTMSSTGVPSTTSGFTDVRIQLLDNGSGPATVHVQAVEIVDDTTTTFPSGVVSITFDDSYQSVWDYARPRMDELGFRGTQFTIASFIGNGATHLTMNELKALQNFSGWDIAGHAYTSTAHDTRYPNLTAAQVEDELRNLKAWLVTNGFDGDSFAYPGGNYSNTTDGVPVESLVSRYFTAGRTILYSIGTFSNIVTETFPVAMRYRMRALSSISSLSTGQANPATLVGTGGALDRIAYSGGWLNLCFHKIVTGTPTATTECSQSDFNMIMDAIAARGIKVVPVSDVMRLYS